MERLFSSITNLSSNLGAGDSSVDRLNARYTVFVLVVCTAIVTTRQYVGNPISCFCPDHFTSSQVAFTNQVCWVTNTYYLPYDKHIPKYHEPKEMIAYYQWVGLFLTAQAILYSAPRKLWVIMSSKSGIAVTAITDAAINCDAKSDHESRNKTLIYMAKVMSTFLRQINRQVIISSRMKSYFWRLYGNYLILLFLAVKFIYIINAFGQLFLVNSFLGTSYHLYGYDILLRLWDGHDLSTSRRFPRIAMCNFKIRILGNVHPYTVQCALPANLFNEIIFIFLWFWFVFVAFASAWSFMYWLFTSIFMKRQLLYVKTSLVALDKLGEAPKKVVRKFVREYLRRDGVLIIRLVSSNASDMTAAELIGHLWDLYTAEKRYEEKLSRKDISLLKDCETEMFSDNEEEKMGNGSAETIPLTDSARMRRTPTAPPIMNSVSTPR